MGCFFYEQLLITVVYKMLIFSCLIFLPNNNFKIYLQENHERATLNGSFKASVL